MVDSPYPLLPNPKFGPCAHPPAQRAKIVAQLEVATPGLVTKATAEALQLYVRYIAGELS